MATMSLLSPGRVLILAANLLYGAGSFAADFNETHVYNPRWPPHAKFHNGQTMSLAALLAAFSSFLVLQSTKGSQAQAKYNLLLAAIAGSLYCGAGACAALYPGTAWIDPEFEKNYTSKAPQRPLFLGVVGAMGVGYAIEAWRMG